MFKPHEEESKGSVWSIGPFIDLVIGALVHWSSVVGVGRVIIRRVLSFASVAGTTRWEMKRRGCGEVRTDDTKVSRVNTHTLTVSIPVDE